MLANSLSCFLYSGYTKKVIEDSEFILIFIYYSFPVFVI